MQRFHEIADSKESITFLKSSVVPVKIWAVKPAFPRKNSVLEKVQGLESRSRSVLERIPEARVPKFPKIEAVRVIVGLDEIRIDV